MGVHVRVLWFLNDLLPSKSMLLTYPAVKSWAQKMTASFLKVASRMFSTGQISAFSADVLSTFGEENHTRIKMHNKK